MQVTAREPSYDEALKEVKKAMSPLMRTIGFRKSSAHIWKLERSQIVIRVRLDVKWSMMGVLQVDLEAAPVTKEAFVEYFWLLLPRLAEREDAYRIQNANERMSLIADLERIIPEFVSKWDSFDGLWAALLRGDLRDDPSFDRGRDVAAMSALEIAFYRDLGADKVAEAVSYIKAQGWQYRLLPDEIAEEFPELLSSRGRST